MVEHNKHDALGNTGVAYELDNGTSSVYTFSDTVGVATHTPTAITVGASVHTKIHFEFATDIQAVVKLSQVDILASVTNNMMFQYKLLSTDSEWIELKTFTYPPGLNTIVDLNEVSCRLLRIIEIDNGGGSIIDHTDTYNFTLIEPNSWEKIEYRYDAQGRRVQKIVDEDQGHWYLFDGYQIIEERTYNSTSDSSLRRQIVFGTAINEPVQVEEDGNTNGSLSDTADKIYIPVLDDRGTMVGVIDGKTKQLIERLYYNSTGLIKSYSTTPNQGDISSEIENLDDEGLNIGRSKFISFGWTGMYHEPVTNLYHTLYREYDAVHERWLSEDPAGYADGLNLYGAYMGVNGVDLLGLDELTKKKTKTGTQVWYTPEGAFGINSESIFVGMLDPKNPNKIIYTTGKSGLSIDYNELQKIADQWFSGIKTSEDFDNLVKGISVESTAPSLGKSIIPIVGSLANAEYAASRGDYGGFVLNSGFAITDIFLVKSLLQGAVKGLGIKLFASEAQTSVKALGQVASHSDEVLASLSKVDPLKWKSLPLGVQIQEVGEFWIKRINPNESGFFKWWGELSINTQFSSLQKLKELATPSFLHEGMLFTKSVGETLGGGQIARFFNLTALKAYLKGSWLLKNPINDIVGRNMGTNGLIFDPAFDWFSLNIMGIFTSTGAKANINAFSKEKGQLEK